MEMKSDWHFSLKIVINIICAFQWEGKTIFLLRVSINLCVLKLFPCFPSLISLLSFASDSDCVFYADLCCYGTTCDSCSNSAPKGKGVQNFSLSDTTCGMAVALTNIEFKKKKKANVEHSNIS